MHMHAMAQTHKWTYIAIIMNRQTDRQTNKINRQAKLMDIANNNIIDSHTEIADTRTEPVHCRHTGK